MDRIAAISISLLVALAVYAFDRSDDSDSEPMSRAVSVEEAVDSGAGGTIFYTSSSVSRRASSGGAGGNKRDSTSLGRPATCVTPLRGCGFPVRKDLPAPLPPTARKLASGGGGFFGFFSGDDE